MVFGWALADCSLLLCCSCAEGRASWIVPPTMANWSTVISKTDRIISRSKMSNCDIFLNQNEVNCNRQGFLKAVISSYWLHKRGKNDQIDQTFFKRRSKCSNVERFDWIEKAENPFKFYRKTLKINWYNSYFNHHLYIVA